MRKPNRINRPHSLNGHSGVHHVTGDEAADIKAKDQQLTAAKLRLADAVLAQRLAEQQAQAAAQALWDGVMAAATDLGINVQEGWNFDVAKMAFTRTGACG